MTNVSVVELTAPPDLHLHFTIIFTMIVFHEIEHSKTQSLFQSGRQ